MRIRLTPTLISLLTVLLLALGLVGSATAAPDGLKLKSRLTTDSLTVHHGPVDVSLVNAGSDGHQLGDLRVTSVETSDADGQPLGRLEATLTTTSVDLPEIGDEHRIGVLVFTLGEAGQDQVTVIGSALYPAEGPTIESGAVTIRPIVGGSGVFAGASGDAVTTHLDDGTWVHKLAFHESRADKAIERAIRLRARESLRDWRTQLKESRAESRDARKEARAQAKQLRNERQAERKDDDGQSTVDDLYSDAAADETGVVRTDLGIAEPGAAPGQELGLWHYAIHAGSELPPHTHPGWQLARVTAGELEYSVEAGEGILLRADGSSEPMGPGTYILAPGDGVIENPDLIHFGANRSEELVTLISATLFPAGEPIATLIAEPSEEVAVEEMAEASPAA